MAETLFPNRPEGAQLGVWVNQDLDVGHGLQTEVCPELFMTGADNLTYTHISRIIFGAKIGGLVVVPEGLESEALKAVEADPCEATFIEFVRVNEQGVIDGLWNGPQGLWKPWITPEPLTSIFENVTPLLKLTHHVDTRGQ